MTDANYIGTFTLYMKEVNRFMKVYNQTLLTPVVNALLLMAVFNLALGHRVETVGDLPFAVFMAPGLIMMAVMQNAFANTSSSFVMGKVMGTIIDYIMPPLSAFEVTFSMIMAGITRGVMVGLLVYAATLVFMPFKIYNPLMALYFLVTTSMLLALLGMLGGIISNSFDQIAALNSYTIVPLTFLSGTFYSVNNLPHFWYVISHMNPFFYMIDGFRYGLTGHHDGNIAIGMMMMAVTNLIIWVIVQLMFAKGFRIKS